MMRRAEPLRRCPDCGGLLQPTEPERLTTAEVVEGAADDRAASPSQCLICGYQEGAPIAAPHAP